MVSSVPFYVFRHHYGAKRVYERHILSTHSRKCLPHIGVCVSLAGIFISPTHSVMCIRASLCVLDTISPSWKENRIRYSPLCGAPFEVAIVKPAPYNLGLRHFSVCFLSKVRSLIPGNVFGLENTFSTYSESTELP